MAACTVAIERPTLTNTIAKLPKGGYNYGYDDEGMFVWVKITPSASYDTGGSSIPLTSLPIKNVTHAYAIGFLNEANDPYDRHHLMALVDPGTSPKLKIYTGSSGASWTEATATTSYSDRTYYFKLYGEAR